MIPVVVSAMREPELLAAGFIVASLVMLVAVRFGSQVRGFSAPTKRRLRV
jgi:hypothetical protein